MTKHKTDDKQDKLLRHAEVFADFWHLAYRAIED